VDRKSRREKDLSVVYLVVGKNGEDIKARVVNNVTRSNLPAAKDLLNNMVSSIGAYNLEVQIQDQDDAVKKAQKKYDGLVSDQKDLEKKIKNLQDKQEQNKTDQKKQDAELKKQQSILEVLKGKRKS
jgi:peptidoglycan hydrolase CwlO-like protein